MYKENSNINVSSFIDPMFNPFQLDEFINIINTKLFNEQIVIVSNKYFICNKNISFENAKFVTLINNNMYLIQNVNFNFLKNIFIDDVHVGTIDKFEIVNNECIQLKQNIFLYLANILEQELVCLDSSLQFVHLYLQNRYSEGTKLTNHTIIKVNFGEVISLIEELKIIYKKFMISKLIIDYSLLKYFKEKVEVIGDRLSKLAGGVTFIQGSIAETFWKLNIVNSIYLINNNSKLFN